MDVKQGNTINYYKDGKVKQIIPFISGKEERGLRNEASKKAQSE